MLANTEGVVNVIPLLGHCFDHAYVLFEPIPLFIVVSVATLSAIVVATILKEDANRFLFTCSNDIWIFMSASNVLKLPTVLRTLLN